MQEMLEKQHLIPPTKSVLAMAPFYLEHESALKDFKIKDSSILNIQQNILDTLPNSGKEIGLISKIYKGTYLYGQEAHLHKFKTLASSHQILHLSTHGQADDRIGDYAYLAFADSKNRSGFKKLYARDLYNLSLNADMVMLSACETGVGQLQKGEGIISLARGFAYAGAKSIFPTLWKVNDEKTKELVVDFYSFLQEGKAKDTALYLAKLNQIKRYKGYGEASHPYFWAALIGIGDMRPIETN